MVLESRGIVPGPPWENRMLKTELDKLRWTKKADGPILIKELDLHGNNRGWLVIDSLGGGKAVGGVRMGAGVTLDEVQKLAAEMTLKFSFLNLPSGGAKAGIRSPSPEKERLSFCASEKLWNLCFEKESTCLGRIWGHIPGILITSCEGPGLGRRNKGRAWTRDIIRLFPCSRPWKQRSRSLAFRYQVLALVYRDWERWDEGWCNSRRRLD